MSAHARVADALDGIGTHALQNASASAGAQHARLAAAAPWTENQQDFAVCARCVRHSEFSRPDFSLSLSMTDSRFEDRVTGPQLNAFGVTQIRLWPAGGDVDLGWKATDFLKIQGIAQDLLKR